MQALKKCVPLTLGIRRGLNQTWRFAGACDKKPREVPSPNFAKYKAMQKRFQVEDGVVVWLKLGARDKMLYQGTLALLGVCMLMTFHTWYLLLLM